MYMKQRGGECPCVHVCGLDAYVGVWVRCTCWCVQGYAEAIRAARLPVDVLFGPAYKVCFRRLLLGLRVLAVIIGVM